LPIRAGHRLLSRHVDTELPHEAQEIGTLETKGARGARAVAPELEQRGLDEPPLELGHRPVKAGSLLGRLGRRRRQRRSDRKLCAHAEEQWQGACHRVGLREFAQMA
jgi:hypothetical protein